MPVDQVFNLHGVWLVMFKGRVTGTWRERGPADACLALLQLGCGYITSTGNVVWYKQRKQREAAK